MKKILTIAVVLGMALVMLSGATAGYGETLQGSTQDAYDGTKLDGGNCTVVHVQDPGDTPVYSGSFATGGFGDYSWDATVLTEAGWVTVPNTAGEDLYFIKEVGNYIAATHADVTETTSIKASQYDMVDRLEPIPTPEANAVGSDYINLTIPAPKYTDASLSVGGSTGQGTFDVVTSYAVFYTDDAGATWTYAGNAEHFVDGPDNPLEPSYDDAINPDGIDTGHYTFNTSTDGGLTLNPETTYNFAVRVNIGPAGTGYGGWNGGVGSYTTWTMGTSSADITTDPASEFGIGMMVPVVAIIGMFVAFTVYRRKKYE